MKIRTDHYKNTSDFEGRKGSATLNMDRLSLFMDNMISNYNKPELAVLREWVSNAHDAHVAAGIKRTLKVTLPTQLNPTLVVQDFGLGMTPDFVENVYLDFGSSSKSTGNDEIGGFGIGGKSALAIASQYTMTTIANGLKSIYIFERSPKGGVDFKNPIHEIPTDEPSGVTVQVAVDRIDQYSEININRVLAGWSNTDIELSTGKKFFSIPDNGTAVSFELDLTDPSKADDPDFEEDVRSEKGYVLNGALDITGEAKRLGDELKLSYGEHVVLVGPVAYIFQPEILSSRVLRDHMVASVNIGDVTFPSSREVIEPTRSNRSFVGKCFEKILAEADKLLQKKADGVANRREALSLHNSPLAKNSQDLEISFKGERIPTTFMLSENETAFQYEHTGGYSGIKGYKLVERHHDEESEFRLIVQMLVVMDDDSSLQSIRNNVRIRHTSLEDSPGRLAGHLVISESPDEWVRASAKAVVKSSELAEIAKDFRKKKRDADAAARAAGLPQPAVPVKRTRRDRIGEYSASWMSFERNEGGKLIAGIRYGDLMEFFTDHFDAKKTLVLSTRESEYHPTDFNGYFTNFELEPKDAQFLSVSTGAKVETLRILLGEDVEIMDLRAWMTANFSRLARFNGRSPREIAQELPLEMDNSIIGLIRDLGESTVHPKYLEFIEAQKELTAAQALVGRNHYTDASRFVKSLLTNFNNARIDERPEFYFLAQASYYRGYELEESRKAAIRQAMNQMMENWLNNLALEEAEAEDAATEAAKISEHRAAVEKPLTINSTN